MINGLDPVLIFNFSKPISSTTPAKDISFLSKTFNTLVKLPPIPLYLSEALTGIYVTSQDKTIEVDTTIATLGDGTDPSIAQRGLQNSVKINMVANNDSIGMLLLTSLLDLIFPLVTAQGATLTYFNGNVVILNGLLHSFQINQDTNSTLMNITLEIIKGHKGVATEVPAPDNSVSLSSAGTASPSAAAVPAGAPIPPPATGPGPGGGASIPIGAGRLL